MSPDRKETLRTMGTMVAIILFQAVNGVLLLSKVHPVYAAAVLAIVTEASWSFGLTTPWLNCFTLALIERVRLGRGRLAIKNHVHWELRAEDRAIGWLPTRKGWRRCMRRLDRLA